MFSNRVKQLWRLSAVRQAFWLLLSYAVISTVALSITYWLILKEMTNAVDDRLALRMEAASIALENGQPLPAANTGQSIELTAEEWPEGFVSIDVTAMDGPDFRYLVRSVKDEYLVLGENVERQEEMRHILIGGMQLSLLFTLLASIAASIWMAQSGQARLNIITRGLARVGSGQLNSKIKLDGDDDLSLLAGQINETVERLDRAIGQIKAQTSHIAHDLRTPLARLRAEVETSLTQLVDKEKPVAQGDLEEALDQIDNIDQIFDALLRLSQIESGMGRSAFSELDLSVLAKKVFETYEAVVADHGQCLKLEISNAKFVLGDADLLIQLLANLIHNALRYGAPQQDILINIQGARLFVCDQGPGLSASEYEKVLQPLYQGETARQGEGHGLGLSMVKAICELHSAELLLSDGPNGKGLCVAVNFPKLTKL